MVPQIKLSEFFALFRPKYVLGTTYTLSLAFFESVVWPHIIRNNKNLRRCIIICDRKGFSRAVAEASALRSVTNDYMAVTAPADVSFHSKVWLMIGDDQAALLAGSGNLTQSGFIDNVELFDALHFSKVGAGRAAALDVVGFLHGLRKMWSDGSHRPTLVTDVLDEVESAMQRITDNIQPGNSDNIRFLSSFGGPLGEQLAPFAGSCDKMLIAVPYFGSSTDGLLLLQRAINPSETIVFPAIHPDGGIDVPIESLRSLPNTSFGLLNLSAGESAFAHLKLYGFLNSHEPSWLFNGSVNCTKAALSGQNIEAGILRQVTPEVIEKYFTPTKGELRAGLTSLSHDRYDGRWFVCWAANLGDSIELTAAPHSLKRAPLRDVTVSVRSGFKVVSFQESTLFPSAKSERLSWTRIPGFKLSGGSPCLIELAGMDKDGEKIYGACFIDDFVALSSDPQQRAAWRAVLSLLGEEGLPEHFEISCVYNLLSEVIESTEPDNRAGQIPGAKIDQPNDDFNDAQDEHSIPIWPPVALKDYISHGPASSQLHKLHWFQRILSTLLARTHSDGGERVDNGAEDDEGKSQSEHTVEAFPEKLRRECQKAVQSIFEDFDSIERKLKPLVVESRVAQRVWPVAVAGLLFTVGMRKAISKSSKGEVEVPSLSELFLRFSALLLGDREQPQGYCTPSGCRYRYEVFPPLAEDLFFNFEIKPHRDMAVILLSVFCYLRALDEGSKMKLFPLNRWILFRRIVGNEYGALFEEKSSVESFYRRYVLEDRDEVSWHGISGAFEALKHSSWTEHPGYRDLKVLVDLRVPPVGKTRGHFSPHLEKGIGIYLRRRRLGHQCFYRVESFIPHCVASPCSKAGIRNPNMQFLRHQRPVICEGCGAVLVPALIYDIFAENEGWPNSPISHS